MQVEIRFLGDATSAITSTEAVSKKLKDVSESAIGTDKALGNIDFTKAAAKILRDVELVLASMRRIVLDAGKADQALKGVEFGTGQAAKVVAEAELMAKAVDNVGDQARQAAHEMTAMQMRSSLGTFIPGRTFVGGPAPDASYVRAQQGEFARQFAREVIQYTGPIGPRRGVTFADATRFDIDRTAGVEGAIRYLERKFGPGGAGVSGGGTGRFIGGVIAGRGIAGGGGGFLSGGAGRLDSPLDFGALVPGGRRATGEVLAAAAAGVTTIGAPLVPAVGALAAIPGMVTAIIAPLGVLKLAFEDVGKAIEGNRKAYEQLTPAQKTFVDQIRAMYPILNGLKQVAGEAVLPGFTSMFQDLAKSPLLGQVAGSIREIGGAISDAAAQWGKFLASSEFANAFGRIMNNAAKDVRLFSDTLLELFKVTGRVLEGFRPLQDFIERTLNHFAHWADNALKAAQANGQLAKANDVIIHSLQLVGQLVSGLADLLEGLYEVFNPLGQQAVPALANAMHNLADWLRKNADTIREVLLGAFNALAGLIEGLWPLVKQLAEWIGKVVDAMGGWNDAFAIIIAGVLLAELLKLVAAMRDFAAASALAATAGGAGPGGLTGVLSGMLGILARFPAATALAAAGLAALVFADDAGTTTDNPKSGDIPQPRQVAFGKDGLWHYVRNGKQVESLPSKGGQGVVTQKMAWDAWDKAHPAKKITMPNGVVVDVPVKPGVGSVAQVEAGVAGAPPSAVVGKILTTPTEDTHLGRLKPAFGVMGTRNLDEGGKAGTVVGAPEYGYVERLSGHPFTGSAGSGAYGKSIYFVGLETGNYYYLTHFNAVYVNVGDTLQRGDPMGTIAYDHIHVELAPGGYTIPAIAGHPAARAAGPGTAGSTSVTPTGGAPPWTPAATAPPDQTEFLTVARRTAIAAARLTKTPADDIRQLQAAYAELDKLFKSHKFKGEELINLLQEMDSVQSEVESLGKEVVNARHLVSKATVRRERLKWQDLEDFLQKTPIAAARFAAEMAKIHDSLFLDWKLSSGALVNIDHEFAKIRGIAKKEGQAAAKALAEGIAQEKAAFDRAWTEIAGLAMDNFEKKWTAKFKEFDRATQTMLQVFDRETQDHLAAMSAAAAAYRTPAEAQLTAMQDAITLRGLRQSLADAEKHLEDLKKGIGVSGDNNAEIIGRIKQIVGHTASARAIDVAQSGVLGGAPSAERMLDPFIRELQDALGTQKQQATAEEMLAAENAVRDAQEALTMYFLQGQAAQERAEQDKIDQAAQQAYQDDRDKIRQGIEDQREKDRLTLEDKHDKARRKFEHDLAEYHAKYLAKIMKGQTLGPQDIKELAHEIGVSVGEIMGVLVPGGTAVGGGSCFEGHTLVLTPQGEREIAEIRAGDRVVVWDFTHEDLVVSPVTEVQSHRNRELLYMKTDLGDVLVTREHRFWTGVDWVEVGEPRSVGS